MLFWFGHGQSLIGKNSILTNSQPVQAGGEFPGGHGGTIITVNGSGQTAPLQGLGDAVHQALGVLVGESWPLWFEYGNRVFKWNPCLLHAASLTAGSSAV